jgi:hypothetical protein
MKRRQTNNQMSQGLVPSVLDGARATLISFIF